MADGSATDYAVACCFMPFGCVDEWMNEWQIAREQRERKLECWTPTKKEQKRSTVVDRDNETIAVTAAVVLLLILLPSIRVKSRLTEWQFKLIVTQSSCDSDLRVAAFDSELRPPCKLVQHGTPPSSS